MKTRKSIHLHAALTAVGVAALLSLAGCGGGGGPERGKIQVDLRPLIAQLNDQAPASASSHAPSAITVPGTTPTTDEVKTLIVGALVIDFTDTPLGPDSSITKDVQKNITTAVTNSVKYIELVSLPVSDPFVGFAVPPPAAKHWEVFVVGTRDKIGFLGDISDNSPIYFGFNTDANGNPYFLSTATFPSDPNYAINVTLRRACIANTPPAGCAQFKNRSGAAVTAAVEILGVTIDGVADKTLKYPLVVRTAADGQAAATTLQGIASLATAAKAVVETTHQLSNGQTAACAAATTVAALRDNCGSQSYTTAF